MAFNRPPIQDGWSDKYNDPPKPSWATWFSNVWNALQYTSASTSMPIFSAYQSGGQTLGVGASKVSFQTKEVDTINAFDNVTNFRYQPTVAGWYQFEGVVTVSLTSTAGLHLYKNGLDYRVGTISAQTASSVESPNLCTLVPMNGTTDYVELYLVVVSGSATTQPLQTSTYFQGFLVART